MIDVVVVGLGPSGLAVLDAVQSMGATVLGVDKGRVCHHLKDFPADMIFFSTAEKLVLDGNTMGEGTGTNPNLGEALAYYEAFAERNKFPLLLDTNVVSIEGKDGDFTLRFSGGDLARARKVVLATGVYSTPILCDIPGENEANVSHYFPGKKGFMGKCILIVGGGNSAAEAAMELASHNDVTLVYRKDSFDTTRIKPWVLPVLETYIERGDVRAIMPGQTLSVSGGVGRIDGEEEVEEIPFDFCFLLTGHRPDRFFLEEGCGLVLEGPKEIPRHHKSLESSRKGIYVAGALVDGNDRRRIFIENGREHGVPIAQHIARALA